MKLSYLLHIVFVGILLISAYIRFQQTSNFDFPFTYDQARDMLDIRVIGNFIDFKVSGPTTSITGLNLGPYYYFLNLPAYWLGGGNPQFLIYWNILLFLATAVAIYLFFYKKNILLGFLIASFFLMAPQLFATTRYFWNAHAVVYLIVLYFLAFWNFIEKRNLLAVVVWGISAGLVIQFEAAFGSMCLFFAFLTVLLHKNWKFVAAFLVSSLPWFLPQLGYEVINGFQMTKRFIGIFTGSNPILGDKLPPSQVIPLHWNTITSFFEGQFMLPYGLGFAILIVAVFFAMRNKKYKKVTLYFLSFIAFAYVYYSVIYHHQLKPWYLEGIRVWYCFIVGIGIVSITKYERFFYVLLIAFILRSFYLTVLDQQVYIVDNGKSNDPKNAANIITTIDWVYVKANGEGFTAYNFVPETYDYSINYLYSWHGKTKYGYTPEKVSYSVDPIPEYIRSETAFQKYRKENTSGQVALIYDTTGNYSPWLSQFKDYCIVDSQKFDFHTVAEWREECKNE